MSAMLLPYRSTCLALSCLLLLVGVSTQRALAANESERPNILFIYTDDHSYRTVGCYPEAFPWVRTPAIDRLAREGMRFESAYIGTWCMPSRATLLTGHHQFGVESMRLEGPYPGSVYDPEQCPFWPRVFREHGYVTAQIGKWHTGVDTGYGRDWDFQIVWNRPKYTKTSQNYYHDQPITHQGGETKILKRYSTDQYTDWAVDFIRGEGRDPSKPWYLWLCYGAVHSPYTPAERHLAQYPSIEVAAPADVFPPRPGKPDWAQRINFWEKGPDATPMWRDRTLTSWVRQYHQGVLAIDEGVERLMATLKETGQRKNTLVVFTSDQGFAWGQHGFRHKVAAYDANIRSPLIISFPGRIPEGSVCPAPVGGVDLVPTFFRFAGIEIPWEMHGHDLSPLLKNATRDWPHPVLLTNTARSYGSDTDVIPSDGGAFHGQIPWYVMLREGRYKYVRPLVAGELEELYDLSEDPEELNNLAVKPEHAETLRRLRAAAIDELRRTGAGFVGQMPPIRGSS
ncbi:MAG: sulfatase-like hydrolase/transferase [Phycisphaerales bacterium]|nr:MAG: sulfatase-like hydrolase/transferase [Phycisphaerales bacterium]